MSLTLRFSSKFVKANTWHNFKNLIHNENRYSKCFKGWTTVGILHQECTSTFKTWLSRTHKSLKGMFHVIWSCDANCSVCGVRILCRWFKLLNQNLIMWKQGNYKLTNLWQGQPLSYFYKLIYLFSEVTWKHDVWNLEVKVIELHTLLFRRQNVS